MREYCNTKLGFIEGRERERKGNAEIMRKRRLAEIRPRVKDFVDIRLAEASSVFVTVDSSELTWSATAAN